MKSQTARNIQDIKSTLIYTFGEGVKLRRGTIRKHLSKVHNMNPTTVTKTINQLLENDFFGYKSGFLIINGRFVVGSPNQSTLGDM